MKCEFCNKEIDGSFGSGRWCSRSCASRDTIKSITKGKTYEELYGVEKANKLKELRRKVFLLRNCKGKTLEKMYGKKKAIEISIKRNKAVRERGKKIKGKTLEEIFGKEKAIKIQTARVEAARKIIKGKTYEEIYGKEKAKDKKEKRRQKLLIKIKEGNPLSKRKWSKEKIISRLKQVGNIKRSEWRIFCRKGVLPKADTALNYFNSLDEIAEKAGIEFIKPKFTGGIGKNETQILNDIEKEKGIKLLRQYYIVGSFIDGYDPINNVGYEVDERHHKNQEIEDFLREQRIKAKLGCDFIRIKDF